MATTVAVLEAALHADTKRFDSAMGKSESKMQKLGKVAGIAGLAIAGGLAVAFKVGFDEMVASQKVMAQTAAVIESTGGVANVTADHVDELSQTLLELSGVDDELITAGQNVLLTFRNIRNEVGEGNDIYDQATKAALDLSVAMGMDLNAAALQVGKALNDPAKGLSKLQRQGVTFTAAQEKLIKKLVEAGDVMGAQKIILGELTTEFGGSAKAVGETLPAKVNKAKEAFADVSAALVEELLPALTTVLEKVDEWVGTLKEHPDLVKGMVIALGGLAAALIAASVAQTILNLAVLANPYVAAAAAIIVLIGVLVLLWKKFEFVRDHWQLLLIGFGLAPVIVATVVKAIIRHWDSIKPVLVAIKDAAVAAFNKIRDVVVPVFNRIRDHIVTQINGAKSVFNTLKNVAVKAFNAIRDAVGKIVGPLKTVRDAFQSIIDRVQSLIGWVGDLISKIGDIPSPGDIANKVLPGSPFGDALGDSNRRAGWGWVGERGPELVNFPGGSRVYSNGVSTAMAGGGGGGTTIILNVPSSALVVDAGKLVRYIDDARRTYGRRGGA